MTPGQREVYSLIRSGSRLGPMPLEEILAKTGTVPSTLGYQLRYLLDNGYIRRVRHGWYQTTETAPPLPRRGAYARIKAIQTALAFADGWIRARELAKTSGVAYGSTRRYLTGMVRTGTVERRGKGPKTEYQWVCRGKARLIIDAMRQRPRRHRRKLSPEQVVAAVLRAEAGESPSVVAKDMGVYPNAIYELLAGRNHEDVLEALAECRTA